MVPGRPVGPVVFRNFAQPPSRVVARITRLPVRSSCVASATGRPAASSTNKYLAPVDPLGEPGKKHGDSSSKLQQRTWIEVNSETQFEVDLARK